MNRVFIAKSGYIITSIAIVLLGFLFLIRPDVSLIVLSRVVGSIVFIAGLAKLYGYFSKDTHQIAFQFGLALGTFSVLLGVLLLVFPERFPDYFSIAIAIIVILDSLCTVQNALESKAFGIKRWWLILTAAIATFAMGILSLLKPLGNTLSNLRIAGVALALDGTENILVAIVTILRRKKNAVKQSI